MAKFSPESRIQDVAGLGEGGRQLLWKHGYDLGDGFTDVLSQYATLEEVHRQGRLRDLAGLLAELKAAS